MKKFLALSALVFSLSAAPVFAEAPATVAAPAKTSHQTQKMSSCAAEYHQKNLAKSEYRKFMTACLKKDYVAGSYVAGTVAAPTAAVVATPAKEAAAAPAAAVKINQKDKMKQCNVDAKTKELKGADRKAFMKTCLSAQ
jgi:hypothetical protein